MTVVSDQGKRTEKVEIAPAGKDFLARRDGDSTLYQMDAMTVQDLRNGGRRREEGLLRRGTEEK